MLRIKSYHTTRTDQVIFCQIILSHIYKYTYIIYRGSPYMSPTALRSGTVILVCFRGLYSAWRMEKATWIPWIWSHVEHVTGLLVAWSRMYCNIICIYTPHITIYFVFAYIFWYVICIRYVYIMCDWKRCSSTCKRLQVLLCGLPPKSVDGWNWSHKDGRFGDGGSYCFINFKSNLYNGSIQLGPFISYNWLFLGDYTFYKWGCYKYL